MGVSGEPVVPIGYPSLDRVMELDPTETPDALYRTVTALVVPRPIGWISTHDGNGGDNLAPFSYYNAVSSRPPVVMVSVGDRDGEPKDTAQNVLATGEFVANLVTEDLQAEMDRTSAAIPTSEFDDVNLTREPANTVAPPRVAAAHAHLECSLRDSMRVGTNTVMFGDVEHISVDDTLLTDGQVDTKKVNAIGRLGGPYYSRIDITDYRRQH